MTQAEAIDRVLSIARSEIGYQETDDNWNKYAEELDPLGITWGHKQGYAWCGEFVLWIFYKAFGKAKALEVQCSGNPSGIPLCSSGAQYYKDAGRWSQTPSRGDVIFFYYGGGINHTGIVESVSGGVVTTIEGNTSDMVARRSYAVGSSVIAGYGKPKWSAVADEPDAPIDEDEPVAPATPVKTVSGLPVLKRGDRGEVVRAAQFMLNGRKCSCGVWGADADFGNATEAAVLAFQRRNGLEADGIIGEQTWSKLLGL